jgi:hypothetical protein
LLIGEVVGVLTSQGRVLLYHDRQYWRLDESRGLRAEAEVQTS